MADPAGSSRRLFKFHNSIHSHRHRTKRRRELDAMNLTRYTLHRPATGSGNTIPLSHYSDNHYHQSMNPDTYPIYPAGDTSSLFGTTELPSLETTPSTVPSSSSSSSSTTASHDEPVVDLTSDSGMEEEEEEDSDGHIDLTVPRRSRTTHSTSVSHRLQHYHEGQRPSCRYAGQSPPGSPDVVIVHVSHNNTGDRLFNTDKETKKPARGGGGDTSGDGDRSVSNSGAKGLNKSSLTCPVCMESIDQFQRSGRQLVTTVCGHIFCSTCIRNSITTMHRCPNCRKKLTLKQYHALYL